MESALQHLWRLRIEWHGHHTKAYQIWALTLFLFIKEVMTELILNVAEDTGVM